jgi:hypothetical protein
LNPGVASPFACIRRHLVFLIVLSFLTFLYFGTIREGHDWGGDFSIYIMQARNIAEHRPFYESLYVPTAESLRDHPAVYPPLTSLILAPVYRAYGLDYRAMKATLMAFLLASLVFYYALAWRRGLPPSVSALIIFSFAVCPLVVMGKESVASDGVFLFFAGATLVLVDFVYERKWDQRAPIAAAFAVAILLMLSYSARATGLALILGFVLTEMIRARRVRLFGAAAGGLTAIAVLGYTKAVFHAAREYGNQFVFAPGILAAHAVYYLKAPALIWAGSPSLVRYGLAVVALVLAASAFFRCLRRPTILEFYVVVYCGVIVVYVTENPRYTLPVLPIVLIYATLGLVWTGERLSERREIRRLGFIVCAGLTLGASLLNLRLLETGPIEDGIRRPDFLAACSFLRDQTPQDSIVLSWNPRVFALYTNKASRLYPQTTDAARFEASLPRSAPVFLVYYAHDLDDRMLTPYLKAASSRCDLVFDQGAFRICKLHAGY